MISPFRGALFNRLLSRGSPRDGPSDVSHSPRFAFGIDSHTGRVESAVTFPVSSNVSQNVEEARLIELCTHELEGMSRKRIKAILSGALRVAI